jgi:hypothetical protein
MTTGPFEAPTSELETKFSIPRLLGDSAALYLRRAPWIALLATVGGLLDGAIGVQWPEAKLTFGTVAANLYMHVGSCVLLLHLDAADRGEPLSVLAAAGRGFVRSVAAFPTILLSGIGLALGWLLIVPGIWLTGRWALVWPVAVLERRGIGVAAERAAAHTAVLLVVRLASWLIVGIAVVPLGVVLGGLPERPWVDALMAAATWAIGVFPTVVAYVCWRELPTGK